jgi:hypothetical protein
LLPSVFFSLIPVHLGFLPTSARVSFPFSTSLHFDVCAAFWPSPVHFACVVGSAYLLLWAFLLTPLLFLQPPILGQLFVMDRGNALRQLLKEKCPGMDFEDEDIQNLVGQGFYIEEILAIATSELLTPVLPTRLGMVAILLKAFVKPTGMFPYQGFAMLMLMFFTDLYATDL